MHLRQVTLIFVYLAAVISIAIADMESNKRVPDRHAFQQMVRYGRSGNKDGKINVYPRADVFYLGPRYGKRAGIAPNPHLDSPRIVNSKSLPCTYTGVTNLFRCIQVPSRSTRQPRK